MAKLVASKDDAEIIRLYTEEHWTTQEISAHLFWSVSTVRERLAANGIKRRGNRTGNPRLGVEEFDKTRELYEQGFTIQQVADLLGKHPSTILERLERLGVKRRRYEERDACKHGHPFTPENTRMKGNTRICRACAREISRRSRAARSQQLA